MVTSLTDSPGAGTFISIAIDNSADLPSKVRQRIRFVKVGIKKHCNLGLIDICGVKSL